MGRVVILGVFVADTAYRAKRQPKMGETILGESFALGPGGKGSNQAVACARVAGDVTFLSKLGQDTFAEIALSTWKMAGVTPQVLRSRESYTGAAYIFIDDATGDNAIIVAPGAAATISEADIESWGDTLRAASIFVTQLEQPIPAAMRALQIAREGGATTVLNPAPAAELPQEMLALCDYVTPNESEAETLTGLPVGSPEEARRAAEVLRAKGVGTAVITLGERGALFHSADNSELVPAFSAGAVVETTGAGDAFNGGFAAALARGEDPLAAVRYGCATAAISVTRPGTAISMPGADEVAALLSRDHA